MHPKRQDHDKRTRLWVVSGGVLHRVVLAALLAEVLQDGGKKRAREPGEGLGVGRRRRARYNITAKINQ